MSISEHFQQQIHPSELFAPDYPKALPVQSQPLALATNFERQSFDSKHPCDGAM